MKRDINLEKEVGRTIEKFNSIKRLPSAFSNSSSKRKLDTADKILIILGVLFFLFIFSGVITKRITNFLYDKLNETDNLTYIQKSNYGNYYSLMDGSTTSYKYIPIEKEVEDG